MIWFYKIINQLSNENNFCGSYVAPFQAQGLNNNNTANCATGYVGPLCEACDVDNGYVEYGYLKCHYCENRNASLVWGILGAFLYGLYQIFSIYVLLSDNKTRYDKQDEFVVAKNHERAFYLTSFLFFSQIISMIYLKAPYIDGKLRALTNIGNPAALIVYSAQCAMLGLGITASNLYYYQIYAAIFLPIIEAIIITGLLYLILRVLKIELSLTQILSFVVLYLIMNYQPGVIMILRQFQHCKTAETYEGGYVSAHPYWRCDTSRYSFIAWTIGWPSVVAWGVVVPLILFGILYWKRNQLTTLKYYKYLGALTTSFKDSCYFWAIVVMAVKVSMSYILQSLISWFLIIYKYLLYSH